MRLNPLSRAVESTWPICLLSSGLVSLTGKLRQHRQHPQRKHATSHLSSAHRRPGRGGGGRSRRRREDVFERSRLARKARRNRDERSRRRDSRRTRRRAVWETVLRVVRGALLRGALDRRVERRGAGESLAAFVEGSRRPENVASRPRERRRKKSDVRRRRFKPTRRLCRMRDARDGLRSPSDE